MTAAAVPETAAIPRELAGYPTFLSPHVATSGAYFGGFWVRVGANLVDTVIQAVLYLVVQYIFQAIASIISAFAHFDAERAITWTSVVALLAVLLYYNLVLVARNAATPGMRMLAMRIVEDRDLTATPSKRTLYLRGVVWLLFSVTGVLRILDALVVAVHPRRRSLHDLLVGTAVVRRAPRPRVMRSLLCTVCGRPVHEGTLCPRHGGSRGLTLTLSGHTASLQVAASVLGIEALLSFIGGIALLVLGSPISGLVSIVIALGVTRLAMSLTQLREWARWGTFVVGLLILISNGALAFTQLRSSGSLTGLYLVDAALGALVSAAMWTPETYREFHSLP